MFFMSKFLPVINCTRNPKSEISISDVKNSKDPEACTKPKNGYFDGLVHMFRATVGTGILALPIAFSQAGYIGGTIGTIFVLFISNYCAHVLVDCQRELSRRNKDMVPTYQGTVQAAFDDGPKSLRPLAPIFVALTNLFSLMGQIGAVCVYFLFIASNLKAAIQPHFDMDLLYVELLVFIPILALNMIPNLKALSVVSSLGSATLLTSVAAVFYYVLRDPISWEGKHAFGALRDLPQFFGTVFFSSCCITMVLPLQNEMESDDKLQGSCGVINLSAYLYGALYLVFGLLGYMKYGDSAADSITLNLPSNEIMGQCVQILLALSVLTATALHNYISVSIIWDDYLEKRMTKHPLLAENLLRITTITLTMLVALLFPNLELLISVTGVIGHCSLNTTLPCIIHILLHYDQPSFWAYVKKFWLDAVAMSFTVLVLVWGLASSFI